MGTRRGLALIFALGILAAAPARADKNGLVERLSVIRSGVINLQRELIDGFHSRNAARTQMKKIQALMKLQHQERDLGEKRMAELERTIGELESRRGVLREKVGVQRKQMRRFLAEFEQSMKMEPRTLHLPEEEKYEAPRRRVLSLLVERGVKEMEALKADMADADLLEQRIQEEKQQLNYLFQDLKEQQSILELNRQLQVDLLQRKHEERLAQLENYHKLKKAEAQVETMIGQFNARRELEHMVDTERTASKAMLQGVFARLKGTLNLPIEGRIVSTFGRSFDPVSKLYVFKKGIDISSPGKEVPVHAVYSGKIAYSGELPNYGRVVIVDHGEHFYSLCAHLGELNRKLGEMVAVGDRIGSTDDKGTPVYFEIRSRNIAVNPLQWISN